MNVWLEGLANDVWHWFILSIDVVPVILKESLHIFSE